MDISKSTEGLPQEKRAGQHMVTRTTRSCSSGRACRAVSPPTLADVRLPVTLAAGAQQAEGSPGCGWGCVSSASRSARAELDGGLGEQRRLSLGRPE